MNIVKYICCMVFLFVCTESYGQREVHVETKHIQKEIKIPHGKKLIFAGERTFMDIRTWDKDYVAFDIEVVAKHKVKEQALEDLEKIKVSLEEVKAGFIYSNALVLKKGVSKPLSSLKVVLKVFAPARTVIDIKNNFGKIDLEGEFSRLSSTSDYTPITMKDVSAKGVFKSNYGDIDIDGYIGELSLITSWSNLLLKRVKAKVDIDIEYGELRFDYDSNIMSQSIKAKYAPIYLNIPDDNLMNFEINCKNCKINSNLADKYKVNMQGPRSALELFESTDSPTLNINSEYEDIQLFFFSQNFSQGK